MNMDLVHDIVLGKLDDELAAIQIAINERRKFLKEVAIEKNAALFKVGDNVRLVDIRPKYMQGAIGTIVEFENFRKSKVTVDVHEGRRRYRGKITCPINCLEKV